MRPSVDVSPYLVTDVRWPASAAPTGVDVVELGEQRGWLPALAIVSVARDDRAVAAVALRDAGPFMVEAGPDICEYGSALPAPWVAAQIRASLARAQRDAGSVA
jgi:hypothetical protein